MPDLIPVITVQDVERFRRDEPFALRLGQRDIRRDQDASTDPVAAYTVADQHVTLTRVEGGYTAEPDCRTCHQGTPCQLVMAAVDAEGTHQFIRKCGADYSAGKRALAL